MRKSLIAAVAGVAIAAASVVAVAGVANASASTPRKATTLSIVEARTSITVGQADTIAGVLKSHRTPLAHRVIVLDRLEARKWRPIEEKYTGKFGRVDFVVRPAVTSAYKLVWRGGSVYAPTHSAIAIVRVKKAVVKTPTALSETVGSGTITAGATGTVNGALTADAKALPKHWVWLGTFSDGKVHALRARLSTPVSNRVWIPRKPGTGAGIASPSPTATSSATAIPSPAPTPSATATA